MLYPMQSILFLRHLRHKNCLVSYQRISYCQGVRTVQFLSWTIHKKLNGPQKDFLFLWFSDVIFFFFFGTQNSYHAAFNCWFADSKKCSKKKMNDPQKLNGLHKKSWTVYSPCQWSRRYWRNFHDFRGFERFWAIFEKNYIYHSFYS